MDSFFFADTYLADAFRGFIIASGGLTMGMSLASATVYARWYREQGRKRLKHMAGVRFGIAILSFLMCVEIGQRIGETITYRSVGAILAFAFLIWSIAGVLYDDEHQLRQ